MYTRLGLEARFTNTLVNSGPKHALICIMVPKEMYIDGRQIL